jgi:hypothetical protein
MNGGLLSKDHDKELIMMLLIVLIMEQADMTLIMALIYILI